MPPVQVTSGKAVEILAVSAGYRFRTRELNAVAEANILPSTRTGRLRYFDLDDLAEFAKTYPYRPALEFDYVGVSILALHEAPAYELLPPHRMLRRWAGYDHLNERGLSPDETAYAITATWRMGVETAQSIVDRGLPVIGAVKGVVTTETILWPTGVIRLDDGIGFEVDPDRRGHPAIDPGAIIDVAPGPPWRLVTQS